jgi:glycosyltransferase involved in cell wall biosynthesis
VNVLLLTSHAIAEHDDLLMFTRMGVPVYSIGGAYDDIPFEGKRPPIPGVVRYPKLEAATDEQRARLSAELGDPRDRIDWAKACLAPEVLDWADTIIVHHFPEQWIGAQWDAIEGKRVIWRTCGQSDPRLEVAMSRYRAEGLQVVRYSPKEREAFGRWGAFAGEDALIRFGKDPDEWTGWHGSEAVVGNITQDMMQRGDACGYDFWAAATDGLSVRPAGPGSDFMRGGVGLLDYEAMREYLRSIRVYLYTGTRPASYTLGLMEAMLTGVPVVAMGAAAFAPRELYEAHNLTLLGFDEPDKARRMLRDLLADQDWAAGIGHGQQARARELFGIERIMGQWADFLGVA